MFETKIKKDKFCSGTEIPLVFPSLLAETVEELKQKDLRLIYFQTYLAVPARLSGEGIAEICSHLNQTASRFVGKTGASYLGGEISVKQSSFNDDGRDELCQIIIEMTGG